MDNAHAEILDVRDQGKWPLLREFLQIDIRILPQRFFLQANGVSHFPILLSVRDDQAVVDVAKIQRAENVLDHDCQDAGVSWVPAV